jgi:hypothetical protein
MVRSCRRNPVLEKSSIAEILGSFTGPNILVLFLKIVVAPALLVFVHAKESMKPPSITNWFAIKVRGELRV